MTLRKTSLLATDAAILTALLMGTSVAHAQWQNGPAAGLDVPANVNIYAMTSDNSIYILTPTATQYVRLGRVDAVNGGNLIGIDFRPADSSLTTLYGLTDKGALYTINVGSSGFGSASQLGSLSPRFAGGFGSLFDFNPSVDAIRIIGSNDQNFAVVKDANGVLNTTAVQTALTYAAGDVNAGRNPEIIGGAYTNNVAGAPTTIFYAIDHDLDTLVTIADKTATGSSNTGGGRLQTIGTLVNQNGTPLNLSPTSDFDIYTDANGNNFLIGQSTRWLFSIDLSQINPNLPLGQTQRVVMKTGPLPPALPSTAPLTGGVFDIAVVRRP